MIGVFRRARYAGCVNDLRPQSARRTVRGEASFSGVTLFTGVAAAVVIRPGRDGIVFRRVDVAGSGEIPADGRHVVPESRRTVLSADPRDTGAATVQTVEHVLSALAGMGVTDAVVELRGPEIPIGDGSALPFVEAIRAAGVVPVADAAAGREAAVVREPIVIQDGAARIEATPTERRGLELTYRLEYPPGAPIPTQEASMFVPLGMPGDKYEEEVAPARTFCLRQEAEAMRAMGMFKHLTPKEMLVIGEQGPIDNALRFGNEPARHKLLDLLGDLSLCGRPVVGRVVATRTGHAHNHEMARRLAELGR